MRSPRTRATSALTANSASSAAERVPAARLPTRPTRKSSKALVTDLRCTAQVPRTVVAQSRGGWLLNGLGSLRSHGTQAGESRGGALAFVVADERVER